jgi:SAM-dependent methyltransferase
LSREQRFTFDEAAELYDRVRPRYPGPLFEELTALAGLSRGDRILEIGPGTGQATRGLAEAGMQVLGVEPGVALARLARENLAAFEGVSFVESTFEDWPLAAAGFDAVVSAQAFHWIDPAIRFEKSADALRPGGSLAVLGHVADISRSPLRPALDEVYTRLTRFLQRESVTSWYAEGGAFVRELEASQRFGAVSIASRRWSRRFETERYLDVLRTYSDHLLLEADELDALLWEVSKVLDAGGGSIEIEYDAHLYVAPRLA